LREIHGEGSLTDSQDYDIESSDDVAVAGVFRYIQIPSPSSSNS